VTLRLTKVSLQAAIHFFSQSRSIDGFRYWVPGCCNRFECHQAVAVVDEDIKRPECLETENTGNFSLDVVTHPLEINRNLIVCIVIQDTGMRPEEVFRIRIENIDWNRRLIFNPHGKTRASRRHVPISLRMFDLLMLRCTGRREGWLFPSSRGATGHLTTVAKQFREARRKAGLPESLVLYSARHTFGTAVYEATGNLAMVMKVMGHTDARTAMQYQHPGLDPIREAIDQRNLRHNPRHSELSVQ
jgi:site-specific recombinase XerD